MKSKIAFSAFVLVLTLFQGAGEAQAGLPGAATNQVIEILPGLSPKATIDALMEVAQRKQLTAKESFDLALAFFANRQFGESVTAARLGLGATDSKQEKAALYVLIASGFGALGNYEAAAEAASVGQRLNPNSQELAAMRIGYYHAIGNEAEALAAKDHLKRIDPNGGDPVFSWEDARIVVVKATIIIIIVYEAAREAWPHLKELVIHFSKIWP